MGKSTKQKLKILYLMRILLEKTDETHQIDMNTILESLRAYDIEAERKSVYSDISLLRDYGLDIIGEKRNNNYLLAMHSISTRASFGNLATCTALRAGNVPSKNVA